MKRLKQRRSSQLTGVAGEYYVAAELSRRGYVASVTLRNARGIDILASSADGSKTITIQVKTRSDYKKDWPLSAKAETLYNAKLFYVFVSLNDGQSPPDYHVVPSKMVATFVRNDHKRWLETPGKRTQTHKDNAMRKFRDPDGVYKNRWASLGL